MSRTYTAIGAILGLLAVAIGAFGAHALKDVLDEEARKVYETGVQYQMYHALALLLIAVLAHTWGESASLRWAARLFLIGILLFSGSLYVLSISGVKVLGAITPLGGVAFIAAWILVVVSALRKKRLDD
ncbi:hypothetical protein AWM70_03135 [Paenibacillus yonginensis]|uniref:DUF423 domain-containing protein n=1 Tax=Paenibacillus yonginensis TaxID=1462996 RepID=A0A1B1MX07_9BACL|nr:DUF423 domain-containing protein [Paenibacillus yonginensis]ANS73689.1 hypothetical protein AWM70_03135 [Paenibacillus yonginensis]